MDRTEQINDIISDYYEERYTKSKEKIKDYYWKNWESIHREFAQTVYRGAAVCSDMGKKVNYIILSILFSSSLTKSYEIQIGFYDDRLQLDDAPVCEYWSPAFIFEFIEEDMEFFKRMAARKIPRIKEYELEGIRNTYIWNHYFLVMLLLRELIPAPVEEICQKFNVLDEKVKVILGRYMEKGILIYQKGQTNEVFSS